MERGECRAPVHALPPPTADGHPPCAQPISVFEGESSYSALTVHEGRLLDLFGFTNVSRRGPNACTRNRACDGKAGLAISLVTTV